MYCSQTVVEKLRIDPKVAQQLKFSRDIVFPTPGFVKRAFPHQSFSLKLCQCSGEPQDVIQKETCVTLSSCEKVANMGHMVTELSFNCIPCKKEKKYICLFHREIYCQQSHQVDYLMINYLMIYLDIILRLDGLILQCYGQ